ncbi:MAG: 16S rRNA (cytidine(1402)-2'-O)-methyltransferase [Gammaproteobacteria bacterium]|nr:16S rRNA (cytidine(1402)-2'-O)-methyltransferase [Gammaproteobacteria bacterium]NIM74896.1 16S rRNA (cytidine(1402)-2'-O)-methyltransferase [Gammaproteobacteria bacterium]NIN39685.1 16S rRNA (cytidine(1402)-2'-O)-methyltransferase [Gammaproteobacteria bacterium]NIO26813.1 16S rRNA (cytidine(1402)-2'-O)-methyltransferase [Gammaproteobacteria bacterium]NIO67369.1 16S rRNA (cytidine(1402)-2'-O)-methyltransferase [Gammaproteobacteria bacterium]
MNSEDRSSTPRDPQRSSGALYVVATPIGNLADIGRRALDVLAGADLILAEDTRHSAKLLSHYGISTACRSFHEHNEARQVAQVVKRIADGAHVALICDAGTPLVSDPGFRLVAALREQGLAVIPVPGPSAAICALSVAGLPTDRFCFEGFLPSRSSARRRVLHTLAREPRTLIFYESPRRLLSAVADMAVEFGDARRAVLARELTKIHESVISGTLAELRDWLAAHAEQRRGECVIVVAGAARDSDDGLAGGVDPEALLRVLIEALPVKQAVAVAARVTGIKRNVLYRQALALAARGREDG